MTTQNLVIYSPSLPLVRASDNEVLGSRYLLRYVHLYGYIAAMIKHELVCFMSPLGIELYREY